MCLPLRNQSSIASRLLSLTKNSAGRKAFPDYSSQDNRVRFADEEGLAFLPIERLEHSRQRFGFGIVEICNSVRLSEASSGLTSFDDAEAEPLPRMLQPFELEGMQGLLRPRSALDCPGMNNQEKPCVRPNSSSDSASGRRWMTDFSKEGTLIVTCAKAMQPLAAEPPGAGLSGCARSLRPPWKRADAERHHDARYSSLRPRTRVLYLLSEFKASHPDQLYGTLRPYPWHRGDGRRRVCERVVVRPHGDDPHARFASLSARMRLWTRYAQSRVRIRIPGPNRTGQ